MYVNLCVCARVPFVYEPSVNCANVYRAGFRVHKDVRVARATARTAKDRCFYRQAACVLVSPLCINCLCSCIYMYIYVSGYNPSLGYD